MTLERLASDLAACNHRQVNCCLLANCGTCCMLNKTLHKYTSLLLHITTPLYAFCFAVHSATLH